MVTQRRRRFRMRLQKPFYELISEGLELGVAGALGKCASGTDTDNGAGQQNSTFDAHDFLDSRR